MSYLEERRALKNGQNKPDKKDDKTQGDAWYRAQLRQAVILNRCEECGKPLIPSMGINPRTVIAHIVDKSPVNGIREVAWHPLNRFFACHECHVSYDRASNEEIKQMRIFGLLKLRVEEFFHLIRESKRSRVPECLRPNE